MRRSSPRSPRWRPRCRRPRRLSALARKAPSGRPDIWSASVSKRHKTSLMTPMTSAVTKSVTPTPFPVPPKIIIQTPLPIPGIILSCARRPMPMSRLGRRGGSSIRSLDRIGPIGGFGPISSPFGNARTWSTPRRRTGSCSGTWRRRWRAPAGRPAGSSRPASSRAGARFTTRTR